MKIENVQKWQPSPNIESFHAKRKISQKVTFINCTVLANHLIVKILFETYTLADIFQYLLKVIFFLMETFRWSLLAEVCW